MSYLHFGKTVKEHRICRFVMVFMLALGLIVGSRGTAEAKDLPPLEELAVLSEANLRYQAIQKETRQLREAGDFAGLEALAAQLRTSRESLATGVWQLTYFYEEAVMVPRKDPAKADEAMKFYERWATERPDSITAQLCLADAYTDYAWAARGSGWASTVTKEGARLMDERLEKAWEILQKAAELPEKCPQWTVVAQTVALGQGWSRDRYMKMVDEALEREPTYYEYYGKAIYWLLPRWYGEEGDFEQWIAEKADASPEKDKQYARLVWQVDALGWPDEMVFEKGRLDWERTKRGFEIWTREAPESLPVRFEFFRLSLLAEDRATAREQLEVTGGKYWKPNWFGKESQFELARQFAYNNGPNPLREKSPVTPKNHALSPQVVHGIQLVGQGIGGFLAGVLCLIFACQRKRLWSGVFMLLVSMTLAILHGTLTVAVPAGVFVMYLLSKEPEDLEEKPPHRWGMTLFWVLLIMGFYLFSQIAATVLALVPAMLAQGFDAASARRLSTELFSSGEGFQIVCNAQWLSLLLLAVMCGRQSLVGWRNRLGLFPVKWRRSIIYLALAELVVVGTGYLLTIFGDSKTKEAMDLIANGFASPWLFILSIVILAPLLEELVVRGYGFQGWLGRFGFYGTALLSNLIFTVIHVQYGWTGLMQIFVLSSALAWLRWKTGSIYPCIALHVMNNALYCLTLYFGIK